MALKRGSRNDSNATLLTSPEAPGDDASRAHFQQQKQQLGQQQQQLQQQLQKLLLVFSFCSKLLLEFSYLSKRLFDFGLKTERMFDLLHLLEFSYLSKCLFDFGLNIEIVFDLLHLLEHKAGDLTRPGQRPGEFCHLEPLPCSLKQISCESVTPCRRNPPHPFAIYQSPW